jgi:hypothetical protein
MPKIIVDPAKLLSLVGSSPPTAETALQIFQRVTDAPSSLHAQGWSADEIFWCRYFYLRLYASLQSIAGSSDAGLEQLTFKLLELPEPRCDPDWQLLEPIDALAKDTAAAWVC